MRFRLTRNKPPERRPVVIEDLRIAVPWYLHPAEEPQQWAELVKQSQLGRIAFAVVNVASGPGEADDPYYPQALAKLHEGGVQIHGYVDTDYSARPPKDVMDDIAVWRERYQVEGIMFDRVSSDPANLSYYGPLVDFGRQVGVQVMVGNPGVVPHADYLEMFDVSCVFENVDSLHRRLTTMPRPVDVAPERLWHLVHEVPPTGFEDVLSRIAAQGAALAFVTDKSGGNPWCGLPPGLIETLDRVGAHARHTART